MGNGQSSVSIRLTAPEHATSATSESSASPANSHVSIRMTAPDDAAFTTSGSSASPANGHVSTLVNAAHDTTSATSGSSASPANGHFLIRVIAPGDTTFPTSSWSSAPPANGDFFIRVTALDDTTSTTSGSSALPANDDFFIRVTALDNDYISTTSGSSSRPVNGDFSISTTAPDDTTRSHRNLACIPIPFDLGICEPISTVAYLVGNAFQPPNNNNQSLDAGPQGDDVNNKILALWIMALLTPSLVIATALYKPASGVVFGRNKAAYYITLGAIFVAGIVELFTAIFLSRSRNAAEKFGTVALCLAILPLVAIIGIGGFAFIQG